MLEKVKSEFTWSSQAGEEKSTCHLFFLLVFFSKLFSPPHLFSLSLASQSLPPFLTPSLRQTAFVSLQIEPLSHLKRHKKIDFSRQKENKVYPLTHTSITFEKKVSLRSQSRRQACPFECVGTDFLLCSPFPSLSVCFLKKTPQSVTVSALLPCSQPRGSEDGRLILELGSVLLRKPIHSYKCMLTQPLHKQLGCL